MHFLHLSLVVVMMQYIEGSMSVHFQVVPGIYKTKWRIAGYMPGFIHLNIFAASPFQLLGACSLLVSYIMLYK